MPIFTYFKLGAIAAVLIALLTLTALWKHAAKERDALQGQVTALQQVNADNKIAFDKLAADTKKADAITSTSLNKNNNVAKKIAKAKQDLQNDKSQPISPELSGYVNQLRELHTNH